MIKEDFKEGDIVFLKLDFQKKYENFEGQFENQKMCIELIGNDNVQCACVWLDKNKHVRRDIFPIDILLKVK